MARRTFFSFNYGKDVWRVNQIRGMPTVIGTAAAGFQDASLWEEAKKKGDAAIKRLIDQGLTNTSVTVVCITWGTAGRKYVNYEIDQSIDRGNGLLGLRIHHLKDQNRRTTRAGSTPQELINGGYKTYTYSNKERLAAWIEAAATAAGK
jgi:methylthioribose-1-phosphate isomerase